MSAARRVSVIVPCRNEAGHVDAFVASVLAQQLPQDWVMEVVIADGQSDDGTRERLTRVAESERRLQVVDNDARIVSSGLNRALERARGEVIVRMDMHTLYAPDYVAACIAALDETRADNVGGPWQAEAEPNAGAWQQAAARAFQSRWVAGGAASRRLDHAGWVDTVYLGAWPRATFARWGDFDEQLVRNQDDEHNLRIVSGGGRIWQSPRIRSVYRPRATLRQTIRQYLQYGYWKPFVMKKHRRAASWRHLVPALFLLALLAAAAATLAGVSVVWMAFLLSAYGMAVVVLCVAVAVAPLPAASFASTVRPGLSFATLLCLPIVIVVYHVAYGLGSLAGWFDVARGRGGRTSFARLSR